MDDRVDDGLGGGMGGRMERREGALMRVSDADRHEVAELLRAAAGEGRLDVDELGERLEAAFAARTYADLAPLTADLPTPGRPAGSVAPRPAAGPVSPALSPAPARTVRRFAVMSGVQRRGSWQVPARVSVSCFWGGAELDLRQATFDAPEVVLTISAVMGGALVIVGPDQDVVVDGFGFMGGYVGPDDRVPPQLHAGSPRIRIRGFAFWGGVSVERRGPDELSR